MADSFTETTSTSWLSRIKGSIKGILLGFILIVAAIMLLWWNEGRAVKVAKGLTEGAGAVVAVSAESVQAEQEGKLVHLSGPLNTDETLYDEIFTVTAPNALKLKRQVEMYQWEEQQSSKTEKKLGGKEETVTTYSYQKTWSPRVIASSQFKKPDGHVNPTQMPYESHTQEANVISLKAFKLSPGLKSQLNAWEALPAQESDLSNLSSELGDRAKISGGNIFIGKNPTSPEVGDLKISFATVQPATVSVIAQQKDDSFHPYKTKQDTHIEMLSIGEVTAADMFEGAQSANRTMTWILRALGFFLMFFGFSALLRPFSVVADVVPFIGRLVGMGMGLVAFLLASIISLLVIAAAWLASRPLLGVAIIAVVIGLVVLFFVKMSRARPAQAAPAPAN